MKTDFRVLCAELLAALRNAIAVVYGEDGTQHISTADPVIAKADAALAAEPEGPSDEELLEHWDLVPGARAYEDDIVDFARAILARWGSPAPPPAVGEVAELVVELKGYVEEGTPLRLVPSVVSRAADLLTRLALQPVPVGKRLPGPEDCILRSDGDWCWGQERSVLTGQAAPRWRLMRVESLEHEAVNWLPAHALPVPTTTETADD